MLYHHDARDYHEAKSESAKKFRAQFEAQIARGAERGKAVLEQIDRDVPRDRIAGARALKWEPVDQGVELLVSDGGRLTLHDHALGQVAERAGLPIKYLRALSAADAAGWGRELLAHNLNELYGRGPASAGRYLLRDVGDELRGFLSDRFRRLDCRPLSLAFLEACNEFGGVAVEGYALPTRVGIKVSLPYIFEPVEGEPMTIGAYWENSDFGDGVHKVETFINRGWCTNLATLESSLRQVHLGKRLSEDFAFSVKTYELDTQASASAMGDIVRHVLAPAHIEKVCALVAAADSDKIDSRKVGEYVKRHLTKSEGESVQRAFDSDDVVNLPKGETTWRLSNAISLVARDMDNRRRALDLMSLAGRVIGNVD